MSLGKRTEDPAYSGLSQFVIFNHGESQKRSRAPSGWMAMRYASRVPILKKFNPILQFEEIRNGAAPPDDIAW